MHIELNLVNIYDVLLLRQFRPGDVAILIKPVEFDVFFVITND